MLSSEPSPQSSIPSQSLLTSTHEALASLKFEDCKDSSSSKSDNCTTGWMYFSANEWTYDLTASIDCNGTG